jgi:hypothetical protein
MALQPVKPPVIEVGGKRFDTTAPAVGDVLEFNGTLWVPGTPPVDNILWQGGCNVWQDGGSYTGLGSTDTYIADGWKFGRDNFATGKLTISADGNSNAPPGKSILMQCTTAEASWTSSAQANLTARIEGQDLAKLGWGMVNAQPATISFWIYSSSAAAGQYTFFFWYDSGTGYRMYKFPFTIATGWQFISHVIPAGPLQVGNDYLIRGMCGITLAAGANLVDSQSQTWHTPDATAKIGLTGQKNFFDNTSNRIDLAAVMLTQGSVARPWVGPNFSEAFRKALRYYEKSFEYGTAPAAGLGYGNGATGFPQIVGAIAAQYSGHVQFSVEKRYVPSVTFYNPQTGGSAQARNISVAADCSSTTTWLLSARGFTIATTTATGSAVGNANCIHWSANIRG